MSSSSISRCVTARSTVGCGVDERPTPAAWSRASASPRSSAERRDVDLHEVRLDLLEIDGHAGRVERLGERARASVVVREPLDVVVERVEAGRRDDPGLAHRAAEEVLLAPRALHQLARAGEQRPERAAEPLREAERHRVEAAGDLGGRDAERGRRVEEPRAVEVDGEPDLARGRDDLVELVERPHAPARGVVRVLEREDRRALVGHLRARLGGARAPAPG